MDNLKEVITSQLNSDIEQDTQNIELSALRTVEFYKKSDQINKAFSNIVEVLDKDSLNYLCEKYLPFDEYKNEVLDIISSRLTSNMSKFEKSEYIYDFLVESDEDLVDEFFDLMSEE